MLLKEREVGGESTTLPRSKLPRVTADFAAMNRTPSKPPTYISVVQRQQELPQQEQQHEEPPPSPHIELLRITADNINHLKQLNRTIFPVSYNEKFYKDVVEFHPPELCRIACIPPASTSSTAVAGNHHLHFSLRNLFQHHNHHTNSHYHNGSSTSSSPSSRFFNLASSTSSSGGGGGGPLRNGLMRIGHPIQQPLASSSLPSTSSSSSSLTTSSTIASNSQFVIVGAICCRKETLLEPHSVISDFACHQGMASRVYIMTIGVLDPYRRLRIGKNNK